MTVTTQPVAAPASVEQEVERIRGLLTEHRFMQAVGAAAALRASYPENRDVLYLLALGLRQSRRTADALRTLEDLERHHPSMSLLYQERGHCYVALKDAARAIEAYERAVRMNPALPDAWKSSSSCPWCSAISARSATFNGTSRSSSTESCLIVATSEKLNSPSGPRADVGLMRPHFSR